MSALDLIGLGQKPADPLEVTHFRGLFLELSTHGIQKRRGPEGWQSFLSTLPPALRREAELPRGAYDWVEPWIVGELMGAYGTWSGEDLRAFRGELYADQLVTVRHQWVLKLMSPETLVRQLPRFYGFYIRGGKLWTEQVSPSQGLVCVEAKAPYQDWSEYVLPSWLRRALELCGACDAQVVYEPPSDPSQPHLHRYWARWT